MTGRGKGGKFKLSFLSNDLENSANLSVQKFWKFRLYLTISAIFAIWTVFGKLKNETFWLLFKHCEKGEIDIITTLPSANSVMYNKIWYVQL